MKKHQIHVYDSFYTVDESTTEETIRTGCPKFFSGTWGPDEAFTMHRGCIISSQTQVFGNDPPVRRHVPYIYDPERRDMFCISGNATPKTLDDAKKLIDWVLKNREYAYSTMKDVLDD